MASQDMERPVAREDGAFPAVPSGTISRGQGTLAIRSSRGSRERHIPRGDSKNSMSGGRGTLSEQELSAGGRRDSREDLRSSSGISSSGISSSGGYADEARGGRLDDGRAGLQRGGRMVDSARGGASGSTTRGSKRGRSVDSDRGGGGGGGGGGEVGFDRGGGEGDPSQAFDSKRMRQPDQVMGEAEGGSSRNSVEAWGRGYGGGGGVRDSPAGGGDAGTGRYREGRMQMPTREVYDGRGSRGSSGLSSAEQGGHRDSRGREQSDDDMRAPREGSKKSSRNERQRSSNSREGEGGGRKDKKKSSKSKKKKH